MLIVAEKVNKRASHRPIHADATTRRPSVSIFALGAPRIRWHNSVAIRRQRAVWRLSSPLPRRAENHRTKRAYRRTVKKCVRGSPGKDARARARLPDENTQHRNRDIKIMKQIPREIGSAWALARCAALSSSMLLHCIALRLIYGSVINYRAVNVP